MIVYFRPPGEEEEMPPAAGALPLDPARTAVLDLRGRGVKVCRSPVLFASSKLTYWWGGGLGVCLVD